MSAPYPRASLRSLLKSHTPSDESLSSNVDAAAFLSFRAFLQRLARESRALAVDEQYGPRAAARREAKGQKGKVVLGKKSVRRAKKTVLKALKA
ncbi:hypothetical protein RQP46_010054 [Phenoliferia psychrophenolica]